MASLGIDYGTGSWKFALIEGPRVLALKWFPDPAELYPMLEETTRTYPHLPIVLPSGFGIPLRRIQEVDDRDLFEMTLRRGDPSEKGLGQFLSRLPQTDLRADCLPSVKLLRSVPVHRKVNRIDMGTADKLCAVACLLHLQMARGESLETQDFLGVGGGGGSLKGDRCRPGRPGRGRPGRNGGTSRAKGPGRDRWRAGVSVPIQQGDGVPWGGARHRSALRPIR